MNLRALALLILVAVLVIVLQLIGCLDKHLHGYAAVLPTTAKETDVHEAVPKPGPHRAGRGARLALCKTTGHFAGRSDPAARGTNARADPESGVAHHRAGGRGGRAADDVGRLHGRRPGGRRDQGGFSTVRRPVTG